MQKMKSNFEKAKIISPSEKKILLNKVNCNPLAMSLLHGSVNDLQASKKAINEFNTSGDDTIKTINDILDSGLLYLKYEDLYFKEIMK